jgi:predicted ATPase/Tfp pilus assembly protein PilF
MSETLRAFLRDRSLLLLLDNCEHLLEACRELALDLLQSCPGLHILATSLQWLGEGQNYLVPTLILPPPQAAISVAAIRASEAGELFAVRAASSTRSFNLKETNAPAIAQICKRLDGLPLAIELAAARVNALPVERIAEHLRDTLLRPHPNGSRMVTRDPALQAALDWSYTCLIDRERVVLRRLSTFAGGWTIKAAERVCAGSDIEEPEVEELLTGLVEKSIVVFDVDGSRYRLLNTVRHYAEDRLLDSGETDTARARHRDFFLDLAERTNVALRGPHQWESLNDIDPENDNFRAALEWSLACGQAGTGLKLAAALGPFWDARGSLTEGRSVLERALEAGRTDVSPEVLGNALYWSGYLAFRETDYERSRERLEESLALCREAGDKLGTAMTLLGLGLVAEARGDDSSARTQFKRSLLLSQEIHDPWGEALVLGNLGHVARKQGNFEEARSFHERSLTILRQVRDSLDTARSIDDRMARVANDIGILAWEQADFEEAAARFEESLTIRRAHNDRVGIGITLSDLGKLAFAKGIYKEARALFEESLATRREILDKRGIAECLLFLGNLDRAEGNYLEATVRLEESLARSHSLGEHGAFAPCLEELARLAKDQGQLERAAKLFGAAERLRETIGPSRPPIGRGDYDHYVDDLRATPAWQEGQKMTPGQVTTFVLGVPGANPPDR